MRKDGCDPDRLMMSDVMCDFCRDEWSETLPMVEGHQGSCICGSCLTIAFVETADANAPGADANAPGSDASAPGSDASAQGAEGGAASTSGVVRGGMCKLCLETRSEPLWQSPLDATALACRRCVRQSAAVLQKDPDSGWRKPELAP